MDSRIAKCQERMGQDRKILAFGHSHSEVCKEFPATTIVGKRLAEDQFDRIWPNGRVEQLYYTEMPRHNG